jgi:hypothetical protein
MSQNSLHENKKDYPDNVILTRLFLKYKLPFPLSIARFEQLMPLYNTQKKLIIFKISFFNKFIRFSSSKANLSYDIDFA